MQYSKQTPVITMKMTRAFVDNAIYFNACSSIPISILLGGLPAILGFGCDVMFSSIQVQANCLEMRAANRHNSTKALASQWNHQISENSREDLFSK